MGAFHSGSEFLKITRYNKNSVLSTFSLVSARNMDGFCVTKAVLYEVTKRRQDPLHHHDFVQLWYVCSGEQAQHIGGRDYTMQPGCMLLVPPVVDHYMSAAYPEDRNFEVIGLNFTGKFITQRLGQAVWEMLFDLMYLYPLLPGRDLSALFLQFEGEEQREMNHLFREIYRLYKEPQRQCPPEVQARLRRIFALVEKRFSGAVTLQQRGRFARRRKVILGAADYVESHYRQVIRLEDICAHVGLSANRFSQLFRDVTGQTLMEYVNFIRIQHARELMINTDWTEREIARQCGFHSDIYFGRVFREYTGCQPRIFRREYSRG